MTLDEGVVQTRALLAEASEGLFKTTELKEWLNEANRDFHNKKGISEIWTVTTTDSDTELALDSTMLKVNRLYFQSTSDATQELIPSIEYQVFRDRIIFNTSHTAGIFTCYGQKLPTDITAGSFDIDTEYTHALVLYAASQGFVKDNNSFYRVTFAQYLELKNRWERKNLDPMDKVQVKLLKGW